MRDVKELIEEVQRLNDKAGQMSQNHIDGDHMLYIELEIARQYLDHAMTALKKSFVRMDRKKRVA